MGVVSVARVTICCLVLLCVGNNFVVGLVGSVNDHSVDIGDVQHFGGLQTV